MRALRILKGKFPWKKPYRISPTKSKPISRNNRAWLFLAPSLIGTGIFVTIPFCDVIKRSFTEVFSGRFVGMQNYRTVVENEAFRLAAGNTVHFLAVCIPLLILLSLILALGIRRLGEKTQGLQAVFLIPMAVPVASLVLFWQLVFHRNGFLNGLLGIFQAAPRDWMNEKSAFAVLVFSYLWKNAGYFMILWMAGLNDIPKSCYEAAKVDGANDRQCFFYVTLPQLVPSFFMITVLAFVNSFKVFREAYLIAGDYPHRSIYMLQHVFNNWFVSLDIQKMSAGAVMLALGLGGILGIFQILEKKLEGGE